MELKKKELTKTKRIGNRLKDLRESKEVSLAEMSQKIRISKEHIELLEACRFDVLPFAPIYQKNIIRLYVKALGEEPKEFVDQYVYEELKKGEKKKQEEEKAISFSQQTWLSHLPLGLKALALCSVVLCVVLYLGLQVRAIVTPPDLLVYEPVEGSVSQDQTIEVHGKTDEKAVVQINGKQISTEHGFFKEPIILSEGMNTIQFTSRKKHGKEISETRHIFFKKNQGLSVREIEQDQL